MPDLMSDAELVTAKRAIDEAYLRGTPSQGSPKALYVTGLAGSGKSTWIEAHAGAYFDSSEAVKIDFDDLRRFHPRYKVLQKSDPRNAAARTNDSVLALHTYLLSRAQAAQKNIILDDVVMGKEVTEDILSGFKSAGYQIDCVVKLRPFDECKKAVQARYEDGLKSGDPRWVDTNEQGQGPDNLVGTLDVITRSHDVASLRVSTSFGDQVMNPPLKPAECAYLLSVAQKLTIGGTRSPQVVRTKNTIKP